MTIVPEAGRCDVETTQDEHVYVTTLTLHQVTMTDAGKFTFLAKNDLGEVKVTVSLVVRGESKFDDIFLMYV